LLCPYAPILQLENQYDTKNIPSLMNVVSQDSKTLGHRMGAFQSALQILQNIVAELQRQGALGVVTCKQLSVILNQVKPVYYHLLCIVFT
jgi:hypothetical protein